MEEVDISEITKAEELAELAWNNQIPKWFQENNPLYFIGNLSPLSIKGKVFFFPSFANLTAILTTDGWILIDCCFQDIGETVLIKILEIANVPINTIIYTHGHSDHIGGAREMEKINIERFGKKIRFVSHINVNGRLDRYCETCNYNRLINQKQFSSEFKMDFANFRRPDLTYSSPSLKMFIGGEELVLFHGKGETDDATYVHIPSISGIATGDFLIWNAPNCGNPQKVQRYPKEWIKALKEMEDLKPTFLFPGHGPHIEGEDRCLSVLRDTRRYLEVIYYQTVSLINQGLPRYQVINNVIIPHDLLSKPYLKVNYDHPIFMIANIWRLLAGHWGGELWNLKYPSIDRIASFICNTLSNKDELIKQIKRNNNSVVSLFIVELLLISYPEDEDVLTIAEEIYSKEAEYDTNTSSMIRNQFNYASQKIKEKRREIKSLL